MKRRILLVDDEVAVLLTLKAVLEISGFEVDTAASAREGVSRLHTREYQMLITDMRMEHDVAGVEVIRAARAAAYRPVVALLTAYPVSDEDWQEMGADQLLVKPMHTRILLKQIEDMIASHERNQTEQGVEVSLAGSGQPAPPMTADKAPVKKVLQKKKTSTKKVAAKKSDTGSKKMAATQIARRKGKTGPSKKTDAELSAKAKASARKTTKTSGKRRP